MSSCLGGDGGECSAAEAGAECAGPVLLCAEPEHSACWNWGGIHCEELPVHFPLPVVWVCSGSISLLLMAPVLQLCSTWAGEVVLPG